MDVIGKTVRSIHSDLNDSGWPTTLIEFTDGTALAIEASAAEEADQSVNVIDAQAVADHLAEFERRQQERDKRQAEIDAFNALPAVEQQRIRAERRAAMGPFARMMEDEFIGMLKSSVIPDFNRSVYATKAKARRS